MPTVLIIDDDHSVLKLLDFAMSKAGFQVILAGDGMSGLEKAQASPPDLAVVDVMMPDLDGYEVCRRLRADPRTANIAIIVLTARAQAVDRETALKAGADEYLVKPVMPEDLIRMAQEVLARPRAAGPVVARPQGRLITVFSLRGGIGVTSLAVNLAVAFAHLRKKEVALLDLDFLSGHVALMLNLRTQLTLANLLEPGGKADEPALDRCLVRHSSGVCALAAPPQPMMPAPDSARGVEHIVPLLKRNFPYIVADTASSLDAVTKAALTACDVLIVIVAAEVQALHTTIASLPALKALGHTDENLWLVLNQNTPQPSLPEQMVSKALQRPVRAQIPYEPALPQAIQRGVPLILDKPRSPMAVAIARLAYQIDKYFEKTST